MIIISTNNINLFNKCIFSVYNVLCIKQGMIWTKFLISWNLHSSGDTDSECGDTYMCNGISGNKTFKEKQSKEWGW